MVLRPVMKEPWQCIIYGLKIISILGNLMLRSLISGSGFNGLCREEEEENNKRFSVQIIPKVSNKI